MMLVILFAGWFSVQATPVFWTGSTITYSHPANSTQSDMLTTNHVGGDSVNNVWLSRGATEPLYNEAAESGWNGSTSPVNTMWVVATNADSVTHAALYHYDTFFNVVGHPGSSPGRSVGKTFFVHIVSDDIYLQLKLTAWGNNNGGTFTYIRTTPAVVALAPTVNITSPAAGAVLAPPGNVTIQASASESGGSITNVQFRVGANIITNVPTAPYTATTNGLASGSYTLTAIASDAGGVTATNSVNITVDLAPVVNVTNPVNNVTLAAPANVTIRAAAGDADGTVTNVQFLVGTSSLANVAGAPFAAVTNGLAAGSYTLVAVASDNLGLKSTNSVTVNVVTPVAVSLAGSALISHTNFQFGYSANIGLSYVIQRTTDLLSGNWVSLVTNAAASNPVVFVDVSATNSNAFYRVGRLPNP